MLKRFLSFEFTELSVWLLALAFILIVLSTNILIGAGPFISANEMMQVN